MTKEELIVALKKLEHSEGVYGYADHERAHIEADDLLIEYIGDKEIAEAFDAIEKWYA